MYPQDDSCRRLLLSEVLLEEYESLDQPQLDPIKLSEIKEQIRQVREASGLPTTGEAPDGEIVLSIYRLMAEAQADTSKDQLRKMYRAWEQEVEDEAVKRAVVADIFGRIEDLRCKYEKKHAEVADETKRQEKVEGEVLKVVAEGGEEANDWEPGVKGTGTGKAKEAEAVNIEDAQKKLAQTFRSALCLSGGGIRSAIFNLGILQGLARHGLLENFDYLSTVSGGGLSGGWLTAWIYREGLSSVVKQLKEPPKSPLKPEPAPLEHLRVYSNYLSPQPGLLSADTWTLVASLLRNLLLNWMVFIPVLMIFLLAPRLWTAILFRSSEYAHFPYLIVGILAGWVSFTFIGWHLPSTNTYKSNPPAERYKARQGPFIIWCLVWMTISAAAFAVFFWLRLGPGMPTFELYKYLALTVGIIIVPWFICVLKILSIREKRHKYLGWMLLFATILIVIAQLVTGYLLRYTTASFLPGNHTHPLLYATFAVPLILLLMSVGGTLIAGFTSRFTNDDDQEWWARAGAWMFIVIVSWSAVHLLVLYGPLMILTLGATYYRIQEIGITKLPWGDIGKIAGTVVGVVSGIIALVGGFSAKTPANAKEAEKAGVTGAALSVLTILAAPIFLAFVFILIALGTDWLLVTNIGQRISCWTAGVTLPSPSPLPSPLPCPLAHPPTSLLEWHRLLLTGTPFRYLVAVAAMLTILTVIMGRLISTNNFSLQYLWRNRIIRACLGASRRAGTRRPNPFTGFDTYDNLLMHELRPQPSEVPPPAPSKGRPEGDLPHWRRDADESLRPRKLMHVLNLALNLTGGKKLQWQDRKAESFTVSPLHAGSYWLGYRRSFCYGGREGISLGAAIAISGAFASPNMGYMMTSPVVRFLMALFNVRFGAWLGNPGPAGDEGNIYDRIVNKFLKVFGAQAPRPFQLRSPRISVLPIVSEAFGSIDDESSYVYLSDGGHFENLGLYEMVVRRCRFIVVSDASSDAEYSFQSLAMAVRQIRIDLGVPIVIPELSVGQPAQDLKSKYCALGTIRYSCVDRDPNDPTTSDEDFDGVLIYIKPSLIGEEPRDVINYWQGSRGFPQETITDQWFSEAQFESYRALGSHIIDAICDPEDRRDQNQVSFAAFARKVYEHNQLDFRAFRESLSYFVLENQSTEAMKLNQYPSYQNKVKRFIDKLLG